MIHRNAYVVFFSVEFSLFRSLNRFISGLISNSFWSFFLLFLCFYLFVCFFILSFVLFCFCCVYVFIVCFIFFPFFFFFVFVFVYVFVLFCFGLFVCFFILFLFCFCFFNAHNSALTTCSVTRRTVTVVTPVWSVLRSAPPIHLFAAALNIVKRGVKHPYPNLTQSSESITAWGRGSRGQGRHGATFKRGEREMAKPCVFALHLETAEIWARKKKTCRTPHFCSLP